MLKLLFFYREVDINAFIIVRLVVSPIKLQSQKWKSSISNEFKLHDGHCGLSDFCSIIDAIVNISVSAS